MGALNLPKKKLRKMTGRKMTGSNMTWGVFINNFKAYAFFFSHTVVQPSSNRSIHLSNCPVCPEVQSNQSSNLSSSLTVQLSSLSSRTEWTAQTGRLDSWTTGLLDRPDSWTAGQTEGFERLSAKNGIFEQVD